MAGRHSQRVRDAERVAAAPRPGPGRTGLWARLLGRGRREAPPPRQRRVEVVDAGDLLRHLLAREDFDAGRQTGHYVACCGRLLLPAALVEPGRGSCRPCVSALAPRLGASR